MSDQPTPIEDQTDAEKEAQRRSRRALIYSIVLGLSFIVLSIGFTLYAFPELPLSRAIGAGIFFGGFLALCSITYSAF